jgi:hypothetical protein
VRRNTVGLVWLVGILLTVALYATGPDRFLQVSFDVLLHLQDVFQAIVASFTVQALELVRALAVGLFAVFVGLAVLASRRGLRARAALVVVTALFLALLYPAMGGYYLSTSRWFGAFLLAAVGALVMTRRLLSPVPQHPAPGDPWTARRL